MLNIIIILMFIVFPQEIAKVPLPPPDVPVPNPDLPTPSKLGK